jgi:hypothetical protein
MILIPDGQVSLGSWASGSCNGGGGSAVVELTVSVGAGAGVCLAVESKPATIIIAATQPIVYVPVTVTHSQNGPMWPAGLLISMDLTLMPLPLKASPRSLALRSCTTALVWCPSQGRSGAPSLAVAGAAGRR